MAIAPPDRGPYFAHGIYSWGSFGSTQKATHPPRLIVRCGYADTGMAPTEVTFRLSPRYGILTALEAHDWFLMMMRNFEEFEVETDVAGEWPVPFSSETVRLVVVD